MDLHSIYLTLKRSITVHLSSANEIGSQPRVHLYILQVQFKMFKVLAQNPGFHLQTF